MSQNNLNKESIPSEVSGQGREYSQNSIETKKIDVYFRDIEEKLIDKIHEYKNHLIFGCVAWLTSPKILAALAGCSNVQIVVQKEDFLRPDLNSPSHWKKDLQKLYSNLRCGLDRYSLKEPIRSLSICDSPEVDAIRCVGNYNQDKNPAFPRMHNKFLVFCKNKKTCIDGRVYYDAIESWTGSFNFTYNATQSLENAILIKDRKIASAYLAEHHHIFGLSEKLNWDTNWMAPEFRIGT